MELAEGLPHPMLGGVWGKVSEEVRKSYLFVAISRNRTSTR